MEKLCYTSMVTFNDDGVSSGDLRRDRWPTTRKWSKRDSEYEREVKDMPIDLFQEDMDHLACADRALSAPRCLSSPTSDVWQSLSPRRRGSTTTRNGSGISSRTCR